MSRLFRTELSEFAGKTVECPIENAPLLAHPLDKTKTRRLRVVATGGNTRVSKLFLVGKPLPLQAIHVLLQGPVVNLGTKKLLQSLSSASSRSGGARESGVLPILPSHSFEPSPIAMNGRDLIEKLCYERFGGAVYLQGEDARGELSAVVLVSDDRVTSALFSAGVSQWVGAAAWTNLCALQTLLQSLVIPVEAPLLEAYGALLGPPPLSGNADLRRLTEVAEGFRAEGQTGAVRVNLPGQSRVQFFHAGQSLGIFAIEPTGHLSHEGGDWSEWAPLLRRAKFELWKSAPQTLFRSPSPFDASHTHALAGFANTAFELGTHLMPPALATQGWSECVSAQAASHSWMDALCAPSTLELPVNRRVRAWESALKECRESREEIVSALSALADAFLEPLAKSIGPSLFRSQAARAISAGQRPLLLEVCVASRWLPLEGANDEEREEATGRVLDAVAGIRVSHVPRRPRTATSTFDF